MTAVDDTDAALATRPGGERSESVPASAIRRRASYYRSYLADALHRLASDPNPEVQRIGEEMRRCLSCVSAGRCTDCPFNRDGASPVHGFAARTRL